MSEITTEHTNQHTALPMPDRFWARVVGDNPLRCWRWIGSGGRGYGIFHVPGRGNVGAHRFAYEQMRGPIPAGLTLDHLCRNRWCVNPAHMEPITTGENVRRGVGLSAENARKVTCPRGHEYTGRDTDGRRYCRPCNTEAARRYRERKAQGA